MADGDGGKLCRGEQLLQPLDAGQIEVVRRLVEQHHIGLGDQGLGDGQPLAPAPGERGRLSIQIHEAGPAPQLSHQAFA